MRRRPRNYIDLEESEVSQAARLVADTLALDVFDQAGRGNCNACGCPRCILAPDGQQIRSHYVVTVGMKQPESLDDIEQVRCEWCDLQCWPAEAES